MSGLSICITVNTTNAPIDKTEPKIKFPEILNLFFKLILLQKLVNYSATELADRKINLKDLSEQIGIANVNLSKIKTGKVSAIRFSTLNAICKALDCQPGDILEYQEDED